MGGTITSQGKKSMLAQAGGALYELSELRNKAFFSLIAGVSISSSIMHIEWKVFFRRNKERDRGNDMENKLQFEHFGIMVDCSRNAVMHVPAVKEWIDTLSDLGYNTVMLYMEDTYEIKGQPFFGRFRGRYSQEELKEIDACAAEHHMEFIPCIQTLAHLNALFRWQPYVDVQDCNDILLAGDDRAYALIDAMFATFAQCIRGKKINIGMDEAFMVGRGHYFDRNGVVDRAEILTRHLTRVAEIADKYGFELLMWGDMFFHMSNCDLKTHYDVEIPQEVKDKIPSNVRLIFWEYSGLTKESYDVKMKAHQAIKEDTWFAGGFWSWTGFAPHNAYSLKTAKAQIDSCLDCDTRDIFFTMWGDNGGECPKHALLPSIYYASEYAKGNRDMDAIKAGFEAKYGIPFDAFLLLDLTGTANDVEDEICNPDKYMLYDDLFMGMLLDSVRKGDGAGYAVCAKKLAAYEKHEKYGYLFKTARCLCEVLAVKMELGIRTREIYETGDREALRALLPDYDALPGLIETFYDAYRKQWYTENKPHGFEIQEHRIGGLLLRVKSCRKTLQAYIDGEIDAIEGMDEPIMQHNGFSVTYESKPTVFNGWQYSVSCGVI